MTIELIGAITLVVGLIGLFAQPNFIVYAFFASTLLGAAAAFILTSLGGTTIQPAHLLLGFLVVKLLGDRDIRMRAIEAASPGTPGFWLLVTVGYSTVTAFLMPRLFQGQTFAYAVRAQGENYLAPLVPTTSNLTQSIYSHRELRLLSRPGRTGSEREWKEMSRASRVDVRDPEPDFWTRSIVVTFATNTTDLLSFIRNSTYSILSDNEAAGFKRIVGSFVEASSFGYWTLGYFAFATTLWLHGIAVRLTLVLSVLSFLTLLFSTSTTAYVGLGGYLVVQFAIIASGFLFGQIRREMAIFMICAPFMFVIVGHRDLPQRRFIRLLLGVAEYVHSRQDVDVLPGLSGRDGTARPYRISSTRSASAQATEACGRRAFRSRLSAASGFWERRATRCSCSRFGSERSRSSRPPSRRRRSPRGPPAWHG